MAWTKLIRGTLSWSLLAASLSGQQETAAPARSTADVVPELHALTALTDGKGFVRIRAGEFSMGSEGGNADELPVHRVRITKDFEMGKFEVTQAQWLAVMRNPHARDKSENDVDEVNPSHFKGQSLPVDSVSWDAVQRFIERLNARDPKHTYRLPTEAEWEYAAHAGSNRSRPDVDAIAWFEGNAGGTTHPVGSKAANAWELHDMLGNVLEWVSDWYANEYGAARATDPQGPAAGSYKVYRGCGWLSDAKQCRPSYRGFDFPIKGYYSVGFRLVRTPN